MIDNKPYYEIKYKKVGEDYYHVGYSSFNIDNVLKWRDECFELVDVKATNADRIRNKKRTERKHKEELADFLCKVKSDYQWMEHEFPSEEEHGEWEEWLQSEVAE